jgi:hypothetical protein
MNGVYDLSLFNNPPAISFLVVVLALRLIPCAHHERPSLGSVDTGRGVDGGLPAGPVAKAAARRSTLHKVFVRSDQAQRAHQVRPPLGP